MASLNTGINQAIPEGFEAPDGLVAVAVFDEFQAAGDAGLSILAMGSPYWTFLHEGGYVICVSNQIADLALKELVEVALLKTRPVHPAVATFPEFQVGPWSFILYAFLLIGVYLWQSQASISGVGRVDSVVMVQNGQWWRAVTALTLHADVVHLFSNLVGGMGFAFLLTRFFGVSLAWLLILLSGVAGNAVNAWLHYPELHLSIGASTGVFGALGMLTGIGIWHAFVETGSGRRLQVPQWLLPAFGGFTLLGLLGVGDSEVDVAAHISGFLCGCVLGVAGAACRKFFQRVETVRFFITGLTLAIIAGAWAAALSLL